eukprot:Clim_evm4s145 gene=Clim_evmTU4s145
MSESTIDQVASNQRSSNTQPTKETPWRDAREWYTVCKQLYSSEKDEVAAGIHRVSAWKLRGKCPVAIECTADLRQILLFSQQHERDNEISHSRKRRKTDETWDGKQVTRMALSMAIVRFINGIVDKDQRGQYARSIAGIAEGIGLPVWIVDIRHSVTHGKLPSMETLSLAAEACVDWLLNEYWAPQTEYLVEKGLVTVTKTSNFDDETSDIQTFPVMVNGNSAKANDSLKRIIARVRTSIEAYVELDDSVRIQESVKDSPKQIPQIADMCSCASTPGDAFAIVLRYVCGLPVIRKASKLPQTFSLSEVAGGLEVVEVPETFQSLWLPFFRGQRTRRSWVLSNVMYVLCLLANNASGGETEQVQCVSRHWLASIVSHCDAGLSVFCKSGNCDDQMLLDDLDTVSNQALTLRKQFFESPATVNGLHALWPTGGVSEERWQRSHAAQLSLTQRLPLAAESYVDVATVNTMAAYFGLLKSGEAGQNGRVREDIETEAFEKEATSLEEIQLFLAAHTDSKVSGVGSDESVGADGPPEEPTVLASNEPSLLVQLGPEDLALEPCPEDDRSSRDEASAKDSSAPSSEVDSVQQELKNRIDIF